MKTVLITFSALLIAATTLFAQPENGKDQELYESGKVKNEYTYKKGDKHGDFKSYYEDGRVMAEGKYKESEREGTFTYYTLDGKIAKKEVYKAGVLISQLVFWEELPKLNKFVFIAEKGFYKIQDKESVEFGSATPDNVVDQVYNDDTGRLDYFIYKGGVAQVYDPEQLDGTNELIYTGKKPGLYVWKDGSKVFKRKLTKEELEKKTSYIDEALDMK